MRNSEVTAIKKRLSVARRKTVIGIAEEYEGITPLPIAFAGIDRTGGQHGRRRQCAACLFITQFLV